MQLDKLGCIYFEKGQFGKRGREVGPFIQVHFCPLPVKNYTGPPLASPNFPLSQNLQSSPFRAETSGTRLIMTRIVMAGLQLYQLWASNGSRVLANRSFPHS